MDGNLAGTKAYSRPHISILPLSPPATYTLIHAFLTKRSHTKVALALKKAVKDVVILKDDVNVEGPQLDEIVKHWKLLAAKKDYVSDPR
jgi:hypothetical protein